MQEHATRPSGPRMGRDPIPADLGVVLRRICAEAREVGRRHLLAWLGVPPEAIALAEIAGGSPELERALRDPAVHALLRDRKTSRELATLLVSASRNAPLDPHVN